MVVDKNASFFLRERHTLDANLAIGFFNPWKLKAI